MKTAREHLTGELQRLRVLSGRSLKDLEAETHASDSSLSRYLSGKTMPPWTVVAGLCRAAGRDPDYLRPIWIAAGKDPGASPPATAEDGTTPAAASALAAPTATTSTTNTPTATMPTPAMPATNMPAAPAPAAPAAPAQTGVAPAAVRTGVRWRQGMVFLVAGALLGVAASQAHKIVSVGGDPPEGTKGPHFSVTLLEPDRSHGAAAIWSFNARCGNADEYRLVYDLPISVQHRATAYRLDHADCTLKLFDGIGGSGIGEPLANDQKLHPVPPGLVRRGSSIVAYSCCNGTVLSHRP